MSWDESLFRAVNGFAGQSAWLDGLALNLSTSSLLWVPGIVLAAFWLWLSRREALLGAPALAATIGIADFLGARLKDLISRPRPCVSLTDIQQVEAACGKVFSFPSNHAINTAVAAAFLQVLYPRSGWVSWPLVGLIGLSRVYIGAHYVTDILGGWVIGGLFGAGVAWLLLRYSRVRTSREHPAV
ncbi:MAG: phosphatase PAP2 family protein [Nitrospiraceae bacterium]